MAPAESPLETWFDRLYSEHGASLRRLAGAYARSVADAEDLFQEICLAVWRALPSFRGACSERTFVFRIAHNRGITHRSRVRDRFEELDPITVADTAPDPDAAVTSAARTQQLLGAVRSLPPALRDIVLLNLEGLSNAEISEVLGVSYSNVGVRLLRARTRLRELLAPLEEP